MRFAALLLSALWLPSLAGAHHSFAEYDQTRTIEISGTLSKVAWQNPHVRLEVQSLDGGQLVTWDIECHSVGILSRASLDAKALKVGDKVKVAGNPSRVAPTRMFGTHLLTGSGRELVMQPGPSPIGRPARGSPSPERKNLRCSRRRSDSSRCGALRSAIRKQRLSHCGAAPWR